ncbi:hypothetical protein [Natronorubrum tibetense]|uniref:Uncharacterized protein n=2 Tax=Natronorubrum tibetense TaxID=63128 RepID=L9W6E0_9EURY|nr:hypothetical protein [Natronorubrum tibetense]ELY43908.1 hypothetical protein C496_04825 [Natronorubrum tibetense GA33]
MLGVWSEHVDELLYDGERVKRRVDLEGATFVVTNDRVLVFTEGGDGPNYWTVERPNVARVSVETEDSLVPLVWGTIVLFLALGVLLLAMTYDLASLADGFDVEDATGIGGSALETVETLLTVFDLTVLAIGLLLLLIAVAFFVQYVRSRSRRLILRVSGDDDISVPVSDDDLEADREIVLQEAIAPGPGPVDSDAVVEADADAAGETAGEQEGATAPADETDIDTEDADVSAGQTDADTEGANEPADGADVDTRDTDAPADRTAGDPTNNLEESG